MEVRRAREKRAIDKERWKPKTGTGKKVWEGTIADIDALIDNGIKILEPEITDLLLPNLETDLLLIGQSKGKFGGGKRRVFKQTQKKTQEGNKPKFATFAVAGNNDGYVGVGYGKSKETVPAREKAIRNAKLNIIKIRRGCGSWQCGCKGPHSIPFTVEGKCGSVILRLMPAPRGTGLCVEHECQKILKLAGIKDVWSKTRGQTGSKYNLVRACMAALQKLITMKLSSRYHEPLGMVEGSIAKTTEVKQNE
ncbi:30S ribosomal protein S5 [Candidatus Woesearchaeota archaeon]|nr:30S ribosomal protein S5 [Candidatus Woesearchaeota archaeon]